MECRHIISQEEAHNCSSDEFASEVSIHLLFAHFWLFSIRTQRGRFFFHGRQLFLVTAKVSTCLGMVAT